MPTLNFQLPSGGFATANVPDDATDAELQAIGNHIASQQTPAPQPTSSAGGAFVRGAKESVGSSIGGALAAAGGGALLGGESGLIGGPIGSLVGAIGGGLAGAFGGQKLQDWLHGPQTPEEQAQNQADIEQHGGWKSAGELASQVPMMLAAPELYGKDVVQTVGQRMASQASAGALFGAAGAGSNVAQGGDASSIPGDIVKGAATMFPLGAWAPVGKIAALLGKPVADAATLAATSSAYDAVTGKAPFNAETLKNTALENVPGFVALHLIGSLLHGHVPNLSEAKAPESELAPQSAELSGQKQPEPGTSAPPGGTSEQPPLVVNSPKTTESTSPKSDFRQGIPSSEIADFLRNYHPGITDEQISQHPEYRAAIDRENEADKAPARVIVDNSPPEALDHSPTNNATTESVRKSYGLPDRPLGEPRTRQAATEDANIALHNDPELGRKLTDYFMVHKDAPAHDWQELVMGHELERATKAADEAARAVNDSYKDGAPDPAAVVAHTDAMKHLENVVDVNGRTGKAWSASGLMRQGKSGLLDENGLVPLSRELLQAQASKGGKPLTKEESASIANAHAKATKDAEAIAKKEAEQQTEQHKQEESQAATEAKQEAAKEQRKTPEQRKAPVKAELEKQAKEAMGRIQKRVLSVAPAAEPALSPPPKAPRTGTFKPGTSTAFGANPLIAAIKDKIGGIKSESSAKADGSFAANKDLWDDKPALSHPTHNQVYSPKGQMPDKAAQALHMQGIGDGTVGGMWEAIGKASKSAAAHATEDTRMAREEKDAARESKNFDAANKPGDGRKAIDPNELAKGDTLNIEGEHVKVISVSYDEHGNADIVTLEDGSKFGRQRVEGDSVIYAESLEKGPAHDFLPAEESAKPPGGDLLAGRTDEPFNLFSESNKERQAREARELAEQNEAKAKQAAIDKAESDKLQGGLFDAPSVSKGVLNTLEEAAKNAEARQKARRQSGQMFFLPVHDLADSAIVGAYHIARGVTDFTAWSKKMVETFGEVIRSHLPGIFKASKQHLEDTKAKIESPSPDSVVSAHTPGAKVDGKFVKDVYKAHIKENLDKPLSREELNKRAFDDVRKAYPDATDRQIRDAWSDYHKVSFPSKDKLKGQIAQGRTLEKLATRLEDILNGIAPKRFGLQRRPLTEEAKALTKQIREAMQKMGMKPDRPENIKTDLARFKDALRRRTVENNRRIQEGDFAKKTPRQIQLDDEARQLGYKLKQSQREMERARYKIAVSERTTPQKIAAATLGWRRASLLSGYHVLGKLSAAALARHAVSPVDEAVGGVIGRLSPTLRAVADKASIEGHFSPKAEAHAFTDGIMAMIHNAKDIMKTGLTPADQYSGKTPLHDLEHYMGRPVAEFFGHLHGLLKSSAKEAEFSRAMTKQAESAYRQGLDPTDKALQIKMSMRAYQKASRAVFQQENVLNDAMKVMLGYLDRTKKPGGKALSFGLRTMLPIVKVPTNFASEAINRTPVGIVRGLYELRQSVKAGLDSLHEDDADRIMRHLKQGSVGTGLLLLGYLAPQIAGGYYQSGENKRGPNDLKPGDIGFRGSHLFMHNSAAEVITMGATVRKVADHIYKGHPEGFISGMGESLMGLASESPFIREAGDVSDVVRGHGEDRQKALGSFSQGLLIPRLSADLASDTDSVASRRTKTVPDYLKAGIPGLRETLPVKRVQ